MAANERGGRAVATQFGRVNCYGTHLRGFRRYNSATQTPSLGHPVPLPCPPHECGRMDTQFNASFPRCHSLPQASCRNALVASAALTGPQQPSRGLSSRA
eukprot:scaffold58510_cov66-Phaeocystis_antarctica.AAC.3